MKKFTYEDYKQLLQAFIDRGYTFVSFNELFREKTDLTVNIFHPIDVGLQFLPRMAQIDHEHKIRSTFHLSVVSRLYNLFSPQSQAVIQGLLNLNHHIGLHWDIESDISNEDQFSILGDLVRPFPLDGMTEHRPPSRQSPLGDITYFADSRGKWRYGHPLDSQEFKEGKQMGLAVHPFLYSEYKSERKITARMHSILATETWANMQLTLVKLCEEEREFQMESMVDINAGLSG